MSPGLCMRRREFGEPCAGAARIHAANHIRVIDGRPTSPEVEVKTLVKLERKLKEALQRIIGKEISQGLDHTLEGCWVCMKTRVRGSLNYRSNMTGDQAVTCIACGSVNSLYCREVRAER